MPSHRVPGFAHVASPGTHTPNRVITPTRA